MLDQRLDAILEDRKVKGRFRSLKEQVVKNNGESSNSASALSSKVTFREKEVVDFSSNDYLSLTQSSHLKSHYLQTISNYSSNPSAPLLGSTGSRLLSGSHSIHSTLETRLASFFSSPSALLFNSGWDANVSLFSSIPQPGDYVVYDELVHASVWDGMRAGRVHVGNRRSFRHNDEKDFRTVVEGILEENAWNGSSPSSSTSATSQPMIFVALESLYSMDGDFCPIPAFIRTLKSIISNSTTKGRLTKDRVCIVLDEAHTTGVYGDGGRGYVDLLGEEAKEWVSVRVMTFGKGVGGQGAVILSSPTIRSFLINYARPFIFSTAMSPNSVLAISCAFDILSSQEGQSRRQQLYSLSKNFTQLLTELPPTNKITFLPPTTYPTPIIPILTSRPHQLSGYLLTKGYLVRPVVYPTVPKGKERVRVCLRAGIDVVEVEGLVRAIKDWVGEGGEATAIKARL